MATRSASSACLPLDAVPLSAIGTDEAFFAAIGVGSVGELAALPRESLAMRCGQRLLDELDQALGRAPEAREFFAPPERFSAGLELPAEVSEAPALVFAARRLLAELSGLLTARGKPNEKTPKDYAPQMLPTASIKREVKQEEDEEEEDEEYEADE